MGREQYVKWRRINYFNKLKRCANKQKRKPTNEEATVWRYLQSLNRYLPEGVFWQRQYIVSKYILDFCCKKAMLALEVDGSSHNNKEYYDAVRQRFLENAGYEIIHITNSDTYSDDVMQRFMVALENKTVFRLEKYNRYGKS